MLKSWTGILCFALVASAQVTGSSPCADLLNSFDQELNAYPQSVAIKCMQTVPFNKNNDARNFWNKFQAVMQFHSDTVWLKDPPASSYKQPAIDLDARMTTISKNIDNGSYTNQWDFEMDVQRMIFDTHHGHIFIYFGLSRLWSFGFPYHVIPVSTDGITVPKLYVGPSNASFVELLEQIQMNETSPLSQINGQDVVEYLTDASSKMVRGFLEPHTDWNGLFPSAIGTVGGVLGAILSSELPWEVEAWNLTLEDGTTAQAIPLASFKGQMSASLADPDVWYSDFVVDSSVSAAATTTSIPSSQSTQSAPSALESAADATITARSTTDGSDSAVLRRRGQSIGWSQTFPAYPPADIVQAEFPTGGLMSGYYLEDVSLGVLSIPTFDNRVNSSENEAPAFSAMIGDFIKGAKNAGMKKILIDARTNPGGDAGLSTEIFNNFFPELTTWTGSRMKLSPALNLLGEIYTTYWSLASTQQRNALSNNKIFPAQWIVTNYLDAVTGKDFSSWNEVQQGSYFQKGDNFTPTMEFDWSNPTFDFEIVGVTIDGYANRAQKGVPNPWDPSDVVVLLDGQCSSTCASFSRRFSDVGVKTVVAGGLPQLGPMQGAGGVRGENSYEWDLLNGNINQSLGLVSQKFVSEFSSILPDQKDYLKVTLGSFNLRDSVRPNASFPQNFAYLPADCRIFYTPDTYNNYTNLWKYAAHSIWSEVGTTGSCLPNSTAKAITTSPDATSTGSASVDSTNSNTTISGSAPTATGSKGQIKANAASVLHYKVEILGILAFWIALMA